MSETTQPAPASSTGSNPNKTMLRNVLTGVITTVLGATAIYFLGYNHKSGDAGYLITKDATVSAWKSFETFENTYAENSISLRKDYANIGMDEYIKQSQRESAKFQKSIEDLSKQKNLDKDMVNALQRRLDNEKMVMPKVENFLTEIKRINQSNIPYNEKNKAILNEETKWASIYNGMFERAVNDIQGIARTLSGRYGQTFSLDDFLVVKINAQTKKTLDSLTALNNNNNNTNQPNPNEDNNNGQQNINNNNPSVDSKNIIGDWSTPGAEIYLYDNGNMEWDVLSTSDVATGTWQLRNNQLNMYVTSQKTGQKLNWVFNLSNVKANSFTMTFSIQPYNIYQLSRMSD